jgi:hypothetical protein
MEIEGEGQETTMTLSTAPAELTADTGEELEAEPIITAPEVLSADPEQGFAVRFLDRDEAGTVAPATDDRSPSTGLFNDW